MGGVIGIIGGSGLYDLPGLTDGRWQTVDTPWGAPSDQLFRGRLDGVELAFLPRHGRGHVLSPSTINYRANIDAMKRLGVTDIVSLSACGSLREDAAPGDFVLVDQFIDRTFARDKSFFGTGCVAHVSVAEPTCPRLADAVAAAAAAVDITAHRGGTYLVMEGPQFSTRAESELYRSWGCDVIGMTNMPEAKLAREAEMGYATVAMVTDYDCWHPDHGHVSVEKVVAVIHANADHARSLVAGAVPRIAAKAAEGPRECHRSLDFAIITAPHARDPEVVAKLDAVAGRVLGTSE